MINETYLIEINKDYDQYPKDFIIGPFNDESLKPHKEKNNEIIRWIDLNGFDVKELVLEDHFFIKETNNKGTSKFVIFSSNNDEIAVFDELIPCLKFIYDNYKKPLN